MRRWPERIAAVIASRKRMRRTTPSPPRCRPAPPLPRRMRNSSTSTGKRNSSTSGSVRRELVMWVCTASVPSKSRPGAGAAGDRLIILVPVVAEGEVVHRALRRRHHPHGAIERVGDALRGLDIAGDHRRRIGRPQHAALGNDDVQRLQAAGIHRDLVVDHGAEDIEHRRLGHRRRRVEVVRPLRRGAGEVDLARRRALRSTVTVAAIFAPSSIS